MFNLQTLGRAHQSKHLIHSHGLSHVRPPSPVRKRARWSNHRLSKRRGLCPRLRGGLKAQVRVRTRTVTKVKASQSRKTIEQEMLPTPEVGTRWRAKAWEWTWTMGRKIGMVKGRMMGKSMARRVCSRAMLILIQEEDPAWNSDWSKLSKISRLKRVTTV